MSVPKYKRYIWFRFSEHYPEGGLGDIESSFDTLGEAIAAATKESYDVDQIVDRDTWEIVWDRDTRPQYGQRGGSLS